MGIVTMLAQCFMLLTQHWLNVFWANVGPMSHFRAQYDIVDLLPQSTLCQYWVNEMPSSLTQYWANVWVSEEKKKKFFLVGPPPLICPTPRLLIIVPCAGSAPLAYPVLVDVFSNFPHYLIRNSPNLPGLFTMDLGVQKIPKYKSEIFLFLFLTFIWCPGSSSWKVINEV